MSLSKNNDCDFWTKRKCLGLLDNTLQNNGQWSWPNIQFGTDKRKCPLKLDDNNSDIENKSKRATK